MENKPFVLAISSRALFNLEDGHRIYEEKGPEAFDEYMRRNEAKPLRRGVAFSLVKKLLSCNRAEGPRRVEVILVSSNTMDAGTRVIKSAEHYGLSLSRAFFTSGANRTKLVQAAGAVLFLSTNPQEVRKALAEGIASATVYPNSNVRKSESGKLCFAFDGDSVLFSDEAEIVTQTQGLAAFEKAEREKGGTPLPDGPFKPVLGALRSLQATMTDEERKALNLRVALVTARGAHSHERVLRTFREWGVRVDEALFLDGNEKGPMLHALEADVFFDDSMGNIRSALQYVPTCHVPYGVNGDKP